MCNAHAHTQAFIHIDKASHIYHFTLHVVPWEFNCIGKPKCAAVSYSMCSCRLPWASLLGTARAAASATSTLRTQWFYNYILVPIAPEGAAVGAVPESLIGL